MKRIYFSIVITAFAMCIFGCSTTVASMREITTEYPRLADNQARVVFIRPSNYAWGYFGKLFDEKMRWVGDIQAETMLTVDVTPGRHWFIAWTENTDIIQVDAAAGRTYYVEVSFTFGAIAPRVHLLALAPDCENWSRLQEWLDRVKEYVPLDEWADKRERNGAELDERLRRAKEHLAEYRDKADGSHFLRDTDGVGKRASKPKPQATRVVVEED